MRQKQKRSEVFTVVPLTPELIQGLYRGKRSATLERLSELQIPFPAQLPDIDILHQFPVNITRTDNKKLRELLSYWSSQFARVNALFGIAKGRHKKLDRLVDREKKKRFRVVSPSATRTKYVDAIWGDVYASNHIARLERQLDESIEIEEVLGALTKDFAIYLEIMQGEMMFRMSEMKMIRQGG